MLLPGVMLVASATSASSRWTLVASTSSSSGAPSCQITDGGNCITDGDGPYEPNEQCTFRADNSFYIDATQFNLENGYDTLTLSSNNVAYTGTNGPNNVLLHAGDTISFVSDYSVVLDGFKICVTTVLGMPPSPPPSPPAAPGAIYTFDSDPGVGWSTGPTDSSSGTALSAMAPYGFNWRQGSTPSSNTGPASGVGGGGRYYYAEASSPRVADDVFELHYDGSACGGDSMIKAVNFAYHMFGSTMGSLALVESGGQERWKVVGQQSNTAIDWKFASGTHTRTPTAQWPEQRPESTAAWTAI